MNQATSILSEFLHMTPEEIVKLAKAETEPQPKQPPFPSLVYCEKVRQRIFKLDASHHPKIGDLMKWGEWFLRHCLNNFRDDNFQLVLAGAPGAGKSSVLAKVYKHVCDWQVDACFEKWEGTALRPLWIDWATVEDLSREEWEHILTDLNESQVIFVDDFGAGGDRFKSGDPAARARKLFEVTDEKWLMVTTNTPRKMFEKQFDARVSDRLKAMRFCDLSGVPSYRPKLAGGKKNHNAEPRNMV